MSWNLAGGALIKRSRLSLKRAGKLKSVQRDTQLSNFQDNLMHLGLLNFIECPLKD